LFTDARHHDDFFVVMPLVIGSPYYLVPLMIGRATWRSRA
jgi:heme/copper-type cytochrome/quinol oxidase subunit 1